MSMALCQTGLNCFKLSDLNDISSVHAGMAHRLLQYFATVDVVRSKLLTWIGTLVLLRINWMLAPATDSDTRSLSDSLTDSDSSSLNRHRRVTDIVL